MSTSTPTPGALESLMDLLVPLQETIDPDLRVSRWRPATVDPPHLYNWIVPSDASIPATDTVVDDLQLAVRIIVQPADTDDQTAALERYWDLARDTIDEAFILPAQSVLSPVTRLATRTKMRNILDVFNNVEYLGLELTLKFELRRRFY